MQGKGIIKEKNEMDVRKIQLKNAKNRIVAE